MSELPVIDAHKVAQREVEKLRAQITEANYREAKLEVLAEALRDERDAARAEIAEFYKSQAPVFDITTLPEGEELCPDSGETSTEENTV